MFKIPKLPSPAYFIIRLSLAFIFIYAGSTKLLTPESFAVIIEAYGLIPESWIMPVAIFLPLLEILAGAGLLADMKGSLETIAVLLAIFMGILGYGMYMGLDVDCGCFSPEDPEGKAYAGIRPAFYRDILMMISVIFLYLWRFKKNIQAVPFNNILNNLKKRGKNLCVK